MCGIAGHIGWRPLARGRIEETLRRLARRGPDARGVFEALAGAGHVTFLHTRLSIIDLDPRSNQPFVEDDCVLVFNGEIYNYVELRDELSRLGHRFRTRSDTEVIIRAFRQWGRRFVDRLEGMWAFALLDQRTGTVLLSRDRFGEKPLFLYSDRSGLYFASEIKAIQSLSGASLRVNPRQLRRYLVNGYRALYKRDETFFENVTELAPATLAVCAPPANDTAISIATEKYYELTYRPQHMSLADAVEGARAALRNAIEIRLRADVPLAFCLSGGVDSSTLAAVAAKQLGCHVTAFSIIDTDRRYDESENIAANVAALGCDHYAIPTSSHGFLDRLAAQVRYHDAPVSTISYYVHNFISEAIGAHGFRVAVSGSGADEIFGGYYDHYNFWLAGMTGRQDLPALIEDWRSGYGSVVRNPLLRNPLAFADAPQRRDHLYLNRELFNGFLVDPLDEDFEEAQFTSDLLRNRMLNELQHEAVPVFLKEDDRNSMYYSVENRSPYLDSRLATFLYTVPSEHLVHDGHAKWILRAIGEGLVPDKVRLDKKKVGFNASIDSLLDRKDSDVIDRLLEPGPIFDIVRRTAIEKTLDGDLTDNSFSKFIFSFVSAKLFLESETAGGVPERARAA